MKKPKILATLSAVFSRTPKKKYNVAAGAAARPALDEYDADEPTTKLSSAFVVVLVLHVVAVGGIYAFNSIKAARRSREQPSAVASESPKSSTSAPATPAATAQRLVENPAALPPLPNVLAPKQAAAKTYQVKSSDNATKIAIAFGLKTDELLAANNLKQDDVLKIGQTLVIPAAKSSVTTAAAEPQKTATPPKQVEVPPTKTTPGKHIVKKGETATSIAKAYGITAKDLLKLNKITDPTKLQLGQVLTIPKKKG